jgi:hypothetical protein
MTLRIHALKLIPVCENVNEQFDQCDDAGDAGPEKQKVEDALQILTHIKLMGAHASEKEGQKQQGGFTNGVKLSYAALGTNFSLGVDDGKTCLAHLLRLCRSIDR